MPIGSARCVRPCRASAVRPPRLSPGHGLGLRIRQRTARIPSHPRAKAGFRVRTLTLAWLYIETLLCVVGGALETRFSTCLSKISFGSRRLTYFRSHAFARAQTDATTQPPWGAERSEAQRGLLREKKLRIAHCKKTSLELGSLREF